MAFSSRMRRPLLVGSAAAAATLLGAAPALAHECVNASKKNQGAGVQVVFDETTGEIGWMSKGVESRIARGLVDLETGEGFHGLIGLDIDGDRVVDVATWIVGPNGEIPLQAQWNGPACKGVVHWDQFMQCQMAPV